ncbi:MAG: tRNA (adenosine(37)-N6)-threonylcarbamoyltransferase complex ATPase subunit type 1 TsaE [Planctomycetota bacterium]
MSQHQLVVHAQDEASTDSLGRSLAEYLPPGTVIGLIGTLGAGKTRLVQAVDAGLGVEPDDVTSPTFVLVNEYLGGRKPVYHFDTYRLRDDDEFLELGPDEYFDGDGITFVEWSDRVADCMPQDYLRIEVEVVSQDSRDFVISGPATLAPIIQDLEGALRS